jgi:uncharacterized peroxidase-related enzyme
VSFAEIPRIARPWQTLEIEPAPSFLAEPPASPEAAAAYEADLAADGYVANYVRAWCWRPDLLAGFAQLRAQLLDGSSLSEREIAVMVAATAGALGDSYCAIAWGTRLAAVSDESVAAGVIRATDVDLSAREAALAAWARAVVTEPNGTTASTVEGLRAVGMSEREIFEATAWIGFRLAFSSINDALGAVPDPELVEQAPPAIRAAVRFGRGSGAAEADP